MIQGALGKATGGYRTICSSPILYRLHTKHRQPVIRHWEKQICHSYDTARPGSSCLRAALKRNFLAECQVRLGRHCAAALHDIDKFFDSIDPVILATNATRNGYPARDLCFALLHHLAPRILRVQGVCSEPVMVYNSILAGCVHSVPLTRALFVEEVPTIIDNNALAKLDLQIDDAVQLAKGDLGEVCGNIAGYH